MKFVRDDKPTYRFELDNNGFRDAVDIQIRCTLFSTGWPRPSGHDREIAVIALPTSYSEISILPARRGWGRRRKPPFTSLGPRLVSLDLAGITDFQKRRLQPNERPRLERGEIGLEELMRLGNESFVSIVVYGVDRYSGSRRVFANRYYTLTDIS
jgi:hypothetical protein